MCTKLHDEPLRDHAWILLNIGIRHCLQNDCHDATFFFKARTLAMKIAMRHRSTVTLVACFLVAIVIATLFLDPVGALSSRQEKVLSNLKIRAQETGHCKDVAVYRTTLICMGLMK